MKVPLIDLLSNKNLDELFDLDIRQILLQEEEEIRESEVTTNNPTSISILGAACE